MSKSLENELIEKSLGRDELSFAQLLNPYQERIYQHILGIVKDTMIAEDIQQDTFLTAYQKLSSFHKNSSFYTWLYRIAHNKALNALKKQKKYSRDVIFKENYIPLEKTKELFDEEVIANALNHLPEKQRQVCELYFMKKIPLKQIAYQLNVPPGTVRSRLHYAKKKLKTWFKKNNNL